MRKPVVLAVAFAFVAAIAGAQMKKAPAPGSKPATATGAATATAPSTPLSVPGAKTTTIPGFPRISMDDAVKMYQQDKAIFIDVRSNGQYQLGHIKGALSIPGSQLINRVREITPGKAIITYCACDAEQSSGRAVQQLMAHGIKNAYALKGGWAEWKSRNLPRAAGPK